MNLVLETTVMRSKKMVNNELYLKLHLTSSRIQQFKIKKIVFCLISVSDWKQYVIDFKFPEILSILHLVQY